MVKRKRKTIAQKVEQAAALLQKYVRMKAADHNGYCECVTCGTKTLWYEGMQGGHFIGRGSISTKLMEENVNPQCVRCNKYLSGNITAYTLYMIDMHGREFVDELQRLKHVPKKYKRDEVEEIIRDLKQKIKELT